MNAGVYYMPFTHIADGNGADAFITMASIIAGATAGYKAQLLWVVASCAGAAYNDEAFEWDIKRIADVSDGTGGTSSAIAVGAMPRQNSVMPNPKCSGGYLYTVEPEAYETHALHHDVTNDRGRIQFVWPAGTGPEIENDQLLGFRIAPRFAGPTQEQWSGVMGFMSS